MSGSHRTRIFLLVFVAAACTSSHDPKPNKQTHWLESCKDDKECGDLACLCGVCTASCDDDGGCERFSSEAACREPGSAPCGTFCDLACKGNADCEPLGSEYECNGGFCRVAGEGPEPVVEENDGGAPPDAGGQPDAGPESGGDAGFAPDAGRDASSPLDNFAEPEGELWEGAIRNFSFESGSDKILIWFTTLSETEGVSGFVRFGDVEPLDPPVDPDAEYPPAPPEYRDPRTDLDGFENYWENRLPVPIEGFNHTIVNATWEVSSSHREGLNLDLKFGIQMLEVWDSWCAMQMPPSDGSGGCLPNVGSAVGGDGCFLDDSETGEPGVPVPCGKWALCVELGVCSCTPSGCTADKGTKPDTEFDLFLNSGPLEGSAGGRINMRSRRGGDITSRTIDLHRQ